MTCNNGSPCFTAETPPPACDNYGDLLALDKVGIGIGQSGTCLITQLEENAVQPICQNIAGPNEYVYSTSTSSGVSYFNTFIPVSPLQTDTAGWISNCPNNGEHCDIVITNGCTPQCQRQQFLGDPLSCCFNDYTCNSESNYCYSYNSTTINATCSVDTPTSPGTRNIASSACTDVIYDYCTGADLAPDDVSWIYRWIQIDGQPINPTIQPPVPNVPSTSRGCYYAYLRNMYSSISPYCINSGSYPVPAGIPTSVSGTASNANLIAGVFAKYQQNGFVLGSTPGTQGYSVFQDFLFDSICGVNPEVCANGLKGICSQYTSETLTLNPTLSNWCGCYLDDTEYNQYAEQYSINKECTPMCNRSSVIPLVDGTGAPIECTQGVCLIDDITINLIDSQAANGVSFTNFCNNCTSTSRCNCTISNTTIDVVNTKVGGSVVINNGCNQTLCIEKTKNGQTTVPCSQTGTNPTENINNQIGGDYTALTQTWFWIILIILVFFFIAIVLAVLIIKPNLLA